MSSASVRQHRRAAGSPHAACAVLTISDTRTRETDDGGRKILQALEEAGHRIVGYEIVKDEPGQIARQLREWVSHSEVQVILSSGGTGIASRDTTIEVVNRLLTKRLDGFGELFRMLSYEEIGSAAMLSRATAGLATGTLVFAMPGSPAAVDLALDKLILPELAHLLWESRR